MRIIPVLSFLLKPYEGVISCDTGHINVHETASVEGSGHKIIICDNDNGKLTGQNIKNIYKKYVDEHMVKPRMGFLANATELGTTYTTSMNDNIHRSRKAKNIVLFLIFI